MKTRTLLAGAGVGAGLTYFLDPARGARRRALVRDSMVHSARVTRRAVGIVGRDMLHRTYGTAASMRSPFRHDATIRLSSTGCDPSSGVLCRIRMLLR